MPDDFRQSVINLAVEFLLYRQQVRRSSFYNNACEKILSEQFSILLWKYTEASGKYVGCPYWSVKAKESFEDTSNGATSSMPPSKKLRHEHLVPRKILTDMFFSLDDISPESVLYIFQKYCIGVVITAEEDVLLNKAGLKQKMPEARWLDDPWTRYKNVGIIVCQP